MTGQPEHLTFSVPLSRRQLLAAGVAFGAVVTGCSDDDSESSGSTETTSSPSTNADQPATSSTTAGASPAGEIRTVESARGPIEIPADPRQIVALDPFVTLQTLDELGAPIAAAGSLGENTRAFVSDDAKQLPSIGVGTELNYEAIASAQPDVIVGLDTYGEEVDLLDDVAPTVLVSRGNWKDNILAVADVVNQREDVESVLGDLDARVEELATAIETAWPDGLRLSVLRVPPDGAIRVYTTYLDNLVASEIIGRLPVTMVGDELSDDDEASYAEISPELLDEVDADVVVYYIGGGVLTTDELESARATLLDSPLWPTLDAVAGERAHEVDAELWFSGSNLLAAGELLDDMERHLTGGS